MNITPKKLMIVKFNLNLSSHIPWRDFATSREMTDTAFFNCRLSFKRNISMILFYYHPEVEEYLFPGLTC